MRNFKVFPFAGGMIALCLSMLAPPNVRAEELISVSDGYAIQQSVRSLDCDLQWDTTALSASDYDVTPGQAFNLYWCDPSYGPPEVLDACLVVDHFEVYFYNGTSWAYLASTSATGMSGIYFNAPGTAYFLVRYVGQCCVWGGGTTACSSDSNTIMIECSSSGLPCATSPNPSSGATGISTSPTLSWSSVSGATAYDVYFGTSTSPSYVTTTSGTSYYPGTLNQNTNYYWGVIPKNSSTSANGCTVWSFKTGGSGGGGCQSNATTLCLNNNRFSVQVTWRDYDGNTGYGTVVPYGTSDSGLFWFFTASNWEMLVKVLNGCGYNNRYWVFAAATTDVEYHLYVTDTATGTVKQYDNTLGNASPAITDSNAFATCP